MSQLIIQKVMIQLREHVNQYKKSPQNITWGKQQKYRRYDLYSHT